MKNRTIETYIVDSFTDEPFKGNPAGVCLLEEELSPQQMLNIAGELNLSETAFLVEKEGYNSIRYFSPKMEIPLCGHATLASAKVLFTDEIEQLVFETIEGRRLIVKREGELIVMSFPAFNTIPDKAPTALLKALDIEKILNCEYNEENKILLLEIGTTVELAKLNPDFGKLIKTHQGINGVVVTTNANDEFDFHSRYFWPWSGTNEDPVTGGTHTFLAGYWSERLGKKILKAYQASERSGSMELELIDENSVLIKGNATIVLEGQLMV